jgi:hypothetical protein
LKFKDEKFAEEIEIIMNKYPIFDKLKKSSGFPLDWKNDVFWG